MKEKIAQLIRFFKRLGKEPECSRRRLAKMLFWMAVPFVIGIWWLTLSLSIRERMVSDVANLAAPAGQAPIEEVIRGFENFRVVVDEIRKDAEGKPLIAE